MKRKARFLRIKYVRKIRDEILNSNNYSRIRHLIKKLPNVSGWSTGYATSYEIQKVVTLKYNGGFEYSFSGYGDFIEGFKAMAQHAYIRWIKTF